MTFPQPPYIHAPKRPVQQGFARSVAVTQPRQYDINLQKIIATAMLATALLVSGTVLSKADKIPAATTATTTSAEDNATKDTNAAPNTPAAPTPPAGATTAQGAAAPQEETTTAVAQGLILPDYLDDRSTPQQLIHSYYNAINRKEYARAYSYYADDSHEPDFSHYAKGYENTRSVAIQLGNTEPDPGAGQIYWTLPLAIEATLNDGKTQVYTGCYTVAMSNPAMQEEPPFKPMTIRAGTLSKSPKPLQDSVPEECEAP